MVQFGPEPAQDSGREGEVRIPPDGGACCNGWWLEVPPPDESPQVLGQSPHALTMTVISAKTSLTQRSATIGAVELQTSPGGGAGTRTRVKGFAGLCLNHSATPPGGGSAYPASCHWLRAPAEDRMIHW
jgi:hypothetical protein